MICFQLFEGEESQVTELWERIKDDRRHVVRMNSVDITYPDELLSTQWGMPLIDPVDMCDILDKQGVVTKNAAKSLNLGEPEDTMTKMWGKWSKKWEKESKKKFKLSMMKSEHVLPEGIDSCFKQELAAA